MEITYKDLESVQEVLQSKRSGRERWRTTHYDPFFQRFIQLFIHFHPKSSKPITTCRHCITKAAKQLEDWLEDYLETTDL